METHCSFVNAKLQVGEAEVPLGVTFEGVEVALMDEEGHISAEAGRTGQICFKSQMVMRGYFNQPDLTASSFTDGWFVMSDIGYLDENRVLYFRGRAGDVITIAGYKIAPTEVEDAARASGLLEECICIKGMSKDGLPFLRLLVVPKKPAEFSDTALRAYLSDHLETYRVPSAIDVVDSIQRNVNGKLDRKYYRSMEQA